jgi:hypothetical protein
MDQSDQSSRFCVFFTFPEYLSLVQVRWTECKALYSTEVRPKWVV